jgi:hypothetical protein
MLGEGRADVTATRDDVEDAGWQKIADEFGVPQ